MKATKINVIKIIGIGLISILILIFSWYIFDRFSLSKQFTYYEINTIDQDSVLSVAIIGDSWVAGKKLDSLLHVDLLKFGVRNTIISSGHPGANSKLIYQNLFEEETKELSSKFIIKKKPDYCILISGVNDANDQVGGNFY